MLTQKDKWGPAGWHFLHAVAFKMYKRPNNPTAEERRWAKRFFQSVGHVLPCEPCNLHYQNYILKHPVNTDTRETLVQWLVNLHNKVNEKNNKPAWQYQKVYDHYHSPNSSFEVILVGIIIVTIIGLVLLYAWILRCSGVTFIFFGIRFKFSFEFAK